MQTNIVESKRSVEIDILRGIACTLMILGHCIQFGSGTEYLQQELYLQSFLYKFIYSFHMPLFGTRSGYLLYSTCNRERNNFFRFLYSRFRRIIVPCFSWAVIYCAARALVLSRTSEGGGYYSVP